MKFVIAITLALTLSTASTYELCERDSKVVPSGRISNGEEARENQFPYMVGLSRKLIDSKTFWCGGSLIGNEWVLTAAHCLTGVVEVDVYLGSPKRLHGLKHTVKSKDIIINEKYNPKSDVNDIGLIKIPFTKFTSNIQPVKLPWKIKSNYDGEKATAAGWGRLSASKMGCVDSLRYAHMPVMSNDACLKFYGNKIGSFKVCADTTGGISTCQGDSGGPLVLESSKIQIGVASLTSSKGCDSGSPAVFTNVVNHLPWIKKHTRISS